jgi:hypothetical protein
VVCRSDLDAVEKRKSRAPGANRTPAVQLVARRYTDSAIQTLVKVKLSLCLIKHHSMKTCWEVEV